MVARCAGVANSQDRGSQRVRETIGKAGEDRASPDLASSANIAGNGEKALHGENGGPEKSESSNGVGFEGMICKTWLHCPSTARAGDAAGVQFGFAGLARD